ncbi:MAG TPA: NAD(P)H-dependent glycerol-3-phosphate dehydrogenase [Phycisphaerales bacterium]|nr:NAD(P)H-dependent glycerol-3-phosphate dehydrogenase [Phycisphaerales bacterium]
MASQIKPKARHAPPDAVVLGLGQMGLVCAGLLHTASQMPNPDVPAWARRGFRVAMWGHDEAEAANLAQTRRSERLPGFVLPGPVSVAMRDEQIEGASFIISAVPVQHMREAWERLAPKIGPDVGVVSVAKGVEEGTLLRPTQVIADVLRSTRRDDPDGKPRPIAALSGPTIAAELARCLPAAMIAAGDDAEFIRHVQAVVGNSWMRVYTNSDVLGVELAGAIKNVVAIAAGICDGLQAGYNAKSALLARGLAEIVRLGTAMGASPQTFFGISGVGDLATTCFSPEGRNRSCGEALGRGRRLEEYIAGSPHVVEGVATTRAVMELARKYRVEMPIVAAVNAVLFEGLDPIAAIGQLMSREQKPERVG